MRRAACLLVAAVALPTSAASARWHATDLGTLGGGFSRATAINERGQVVGSAVPSGARTSTHHCFLWEHGVMRDLGAPAGTHDCRPVAIDDAGEIAGTSGRRAFLWRNGRFLDLGPGEAVALDPAGDVVLGRGPRSLVWRAGRTIRLQAPHGRGALTAAHRILGAGDVYGTVVVARGRRATPWPHAVRWHDGTLRYLPEPPGATASWIDSVNAAGTISGTVQFAKPNDTKAVVWRRGRVHVIRTPHSGGTGEAVSGLGEVGVVDSAAYVWSAGRLLTASSSWLDFTCGNSHLLAGQRRRAFVWMHDTLTWLPAGASGVNGCNDHDQLVGWSTVHGPHIAGRAPVHAMLWSH